MRMLLQVSLPHEPFNSFVKDGSAGSRIKRILEETRPEATYFTEIDGRRTAMLIVDLADASRIPALAEPWFLQFQADVHLHPVMSAEDLGRGGLETLGKKWA